MDDRAVALNMPDTYPSHYTASHADLRAASTAPRQRRKQMKKYWDYRYFTQDDYAHASAIQFSIPDNWDFHYWRPYAIDAARPAPLLAITGQHQLRKFGQNVHRNEVEATKYRRHTMRAGRFCAKPKLRAMDNDWLSEQQKWDVDAGEEDGRLEAEEYFRGFDNSETDPVSEVLCGLPHQDAQPEPLASLDDDTDGADVASEAGDEWCVVDNWLTVLSDDESSDPWDLESECGLSGSFLFD